eukprot:7901355-Pyramimonas_sp.AAC.1
MALELLLLNYPAELLRAAIHSLPWSIGAQGARAAWRRFDLLRSLSGSTPPKPSPRTAVAGKGGGRGGNFQFRDRAPDWRDRRPNRGWDRDRDRDRQQFRRPRTPSPDRRREE